MLEEKVRKQHQSQGRGGGERSLSPKGAPPTRRGKQHPPKKMERRNSTTPAVVTFSLEFAAVPTQEVKVKRSRVDGFHSVQSGSLSFQPSRATAGSDIFTLRRSKESPPPSCRPQRFSSQNECSNHSDETELRSPSPGHRRE